VISILQRARASFVTKLSGKEHLEMPDNPQPNFRTQELDAGLLATPFRVQTNWQVITGAPSCGKTTLIDLLADKGFQTVPEGARLYLEKEIASGRTIEQIRSNETALQCSIKDMQLEIERGLRVNDLLFLDRALPDCLAWYRVFGLNPNAFLRECFHYRYAAVFMLDRLPLQLDSLRYKDEALQDFTEQWHIRDYSALGYHIVRVPVLPPEERLAFVLDVISNRSQD